MSRKREFPFAANAAVAAFSTAGAAEEMRIASSVQAGHGPFFVARQKGILEEEGLDVDPVLDGAAILRSTALASYQIDILARQHVLSPIQDESKKPHGAA